MKILILEDDPNRILTFRRSLIGQNLTIVETATEAIKELENPESDFSIIFLDHDLGGKIFVSEADENTGSEVVRWMISNMETIPTVVIHSHNEPAALNMQSALKSRYSNTAIQRVPFIHLKKLMESPNFI